MFKDQRGVVFTCANDSAVTAFDETIVAYLASSLETGPKLKATLAADPDMTMAHCLKGYFFLLMGNASLLPRARKAFDQARQRVGKTTSREQAHVHALDLWLDDRADEATRLWEQILQDNPRDILAQRLAHHGHFYAGDSQQMRSSLERTARFWNAGDPGFGYILGMRSFAQEECGSYAEAEVTGRSAVDIEPNNPWAVHAVAHVMEMQDRPADGLVWIREQQQNWDTANNFRYHLWWHRALMHLDQGDTTEALRLYDEDLWDAESEEYLDLCNDVALLARLEILGVDVGPRWKPLADKIKGRAADHLLSFIDAHFALGLAAAGDDRSVERLLETMEEKGGELRIRVGLPLCRAMVAYRSGDFDRAASELVVLRGDIIRIGGSHAQRDLFEQILIDATIRSGDLAMAEKLVRERTANNPGNGLAWQKLADIQEMTGAAGQAADCRGRANGLLVVN